ncbi:protein ROH1A-like [Curcuma longa]|uniref:protein ROH1A-like n=1 Tax=Curcuma longa TaxID=136217 RepID=UPI003D9F7238
MMAMPENQGGGSPVSMACRPFSSLRRGAQVVSMDQGQEQDVDLFQKHVADHLLSLLPSSTAGLEPPCQLQPLLTLAFLSKMLEALLFLEEEFQSLLGRSHAGILADRGVADLLNRSVKSLDVCNSVSLSLHSLRLWYRPAVIASSVLLPDRCGEDASLNRARRAIGKLLASSHESSYNATASMGGDWSGSSGRFGNSQIRALSWGVSKNLSAGRTMPLMPAHLAAPRGDEAGGAGVALAVYAMSSLLAFTMWALAAAVPSQDRSSTALSSPVSPRQHLPWAGAMIELQERITGEWRRRRRGSSAGLLAEFQRVERSMRDLMEAMGERGAVTSRAEEVEARAGELAEACRKLSEGVGPLEKQVREVFHRLVGIRAEVIRCVDHTSLAAAAAASVPHLVS